MSYPGPIQPPEQLGTLTQVGLALASAAILALILVFVWRATRSQRRQDADVVSRVDACFSALADRRGLSLDRPRPLDHPVLGQVAVAPRLAGSIDGFAVALAVEADAARDGDEQTTLRISARAGGPDWPRVDKPCKRREQLPASAHAALERLCAASHRVQLDGRTLIAEPKVRPTTDVNGRVRRIETDVDRLDGWLQLALELARTL